MTFGSLFAGIGGIDLGLERAGMVCRWQVEIDDYATRVLERHWPNVPRWRDIADFIADAEKLHGNASCDNARSDQESTGRRTVSESRNGDSLQTNLICGGFPCQPVSVAGRRDGMADERWLWDSFREVVRILRPRFVLIENVPGLLSAKDAMGNQGGLFQGILGDLYRMRYDAEWATIPAAAFGAPHLRKRVFVVSYAQHDACGDTPAGDVERRQPERAMFGSDGEARAASDTEQNGSPTGSGQHRGTQEKGRMQQPQGQFTEWRTIKPTIRRGDNGVSFELDFIGRLNDEHSYDPKTNPTGIWADCCKRFLRSVWDQRKLAAASPRLFQDRVLASVPEVPYVDSHGGWYVGARIEKDKRLRDLWQQFYAEALNKSDLQQKLLERIRKTKCTQTVERVDRLRCLGNAVVPQVAEWIGRRILDRFPVGV